MIYKVIGLMSGSSLDGLDIAYVMLEESGGKWNYEILKVACYDYDGAWTRRLRDATGLPAYDYKLLDAEYGHYLGEQVNKFIKENELDHKVHFIVSHGHTTFHSPVKKVTHQIGEGAAIAAETGLPVISDLRALDIALRGQGAPLVPIGERLLFPQYNYFLNIGGIANLSVITENAIKAFDVCPANRVLNMLAEEKQLEYDEGGKLAASGKVNEELLNRLNELDYYKRPAPKSLSNSFGIDIIYPMIKSYSLTTEDGLRTYVEHIVTQVVYAIGYEQTTTGTKQLFVTGGGAFNSFLIGRLQESGVNVFLPSEDVIRYKEALIIALAGALRWRQEYNVLKAVTGAQRDSIGGALWLGTEA
jgi:anhydro-N-acetylmuramic acid kinase